MQQTERMASTTSLLIRRPGNKALTAQQRLRLVLPQKSVPKTPQNRPGVRSRNVPWAAYTPYCIAEQWSRCIPTQSSETDQQMEPTCGTTLHHLTYLYNPQLCGCTDNCPHLANILA